MTFLVGYDGSNVAKSALQLAREYAKVFGIDVTVIASVEGKTVTRDIDLENARKNLAYAEKFMEEENIPTKTELLVRGFNPGEDIVKYIIDNEIQAVFIGVQRRSRVDKMLFGSNAQYIILNSPRPVISVK